MNTIRVQIFVFASLLFLILAALVIFTFRASLTERKFVQDNAVGNRLAGHLNAAAGWQAIERGIGATMLGGNPELASPFLDELNEARRQGDAEVAQADQRAIELTSRKNDSVFTVRLTTWRRDFEALLAARPRLEDGSISKDEWLAVTTKNIQNEFDLRDNAFAATDGHDRVIYVNAVLRPNIATLAEFAGLERALIGNAIAAGAPLSDEEMNQVKRYRALVDMSIDQVLLLKGHPSNSATMEQAIENFEAKFLGTFQGLREEIFAASALQEEELRSVFLDVYKRQEVIARYMFGISTELLSLGGHASVRALADGLVRGEENGFAERLSTVETTFEGYGSVMGVFDQIRYLDAAGVERVRVDFKEGTPIPIRGAALQDKHQRSYFRLAAALPPGEFYVSELDLNVERGEIERPFKPVIRYAEPVYAEGELAGVIVFNLLAQVRGLLHYNALETGGAENYILSNREGFYLHHPDDAKEWGLMEQLDRSHHNVKEDYSEVADQVLSGKTGVVRLESGETIIYEPVFFRGEHDTEEFWVILKSVRPVAYPITAKVWFDEAREAINSMLAMSEAAGDLADNAMTATNTAATRMMIISLMLFIFAVMVFAFFAYWSTNRILLPIQHLIRVTKRIAQGDFSQRVKVLGSGELGLLGESFNTMTQERNEMQAAIAEKNTLLQKALAAEINTLRGIVPICAQCKKIRDDTGFWQQVEVYVRDHSEAEFSHGLCPECIKDLYPEDVDPGALEN